MFTRLVKYLFAGSVLLSSQVYAGTDSIFCGTQTQVGGAYCTSFGTVKALLIFIDFKDDTNDPTNPTRPVGTGPNFLNSIVDETETINSGIYANVSTFFKDMSYGQFRMIGKAYFVQAPESIAFYRRAYRDQEVKYSTRDAIQILDQMVDFSDFDRWTSTYYNHTLDPDGKIDMVFVCYRIWNKYLFRNIR